MGAEIGRKSPETAITEAETTHIVPATTRTEAVIAHREAKTAYAEDTASYITHVTI